MHCSYIFQVYLYERHLSNYLHLSKEIMFLYENGFNIIDQRKYCKGKEEKCRNLLDRTLLKVGSQYVWFWVWVAIEPLAKVIVSFRI